MSKVTAESFQTKDSVFMSGNFSAKHIKPTINETIPEIKATGDPTSTKPSTVTITGGFKTINTQDNNEFNNQLGVSINRTPHRESLLSASITSKGTEFSIKKSISNTEQSSIHRARSMNLPNDIVTEERREFTPIENDMPNVIDTDESIMFRQPQPHNRFLKNKSFNRNIKTFTGMYWKFAGEDLEDGEEEEEDDEDESEMEDEENISSSSGKKTTTLKAFLLLLKAFLGTGIIFLPKAFSNGGLLFSNLMIISFSLISYFCFIILIKTTSKCNVSGYGDVGFKLYGGIFQFIILLSLALSQLGFASTYIVFVSKNFKQIIDRLLGDEYSIGCFIIIQFLIFVPISFTRNISKLGACALIADIFIFLGLIYIYFQSSHKLIVDGIADNLIMFNSNNWTLFIGTAVFTYEGIGLLIPIQESMKYPENFNKLLFIVMIIVTIVFTSIASISYLSFGNNVHTIILMNFPMNEMTIIIQILYSMAILLSTPIQIFPTIKIIESYLFNKERKTWKDKIRRNSEAISILSNNTSSALSTYSSIMGSPNMNLVNNEGLVSGKSDNSIKLMKNILRIIVISIMSLISYLGSENLDKFVSLIGSLTCVPLIYIYPPLLYYKQFQSEMRTIEKCFTLIVLISGCVVMSYTSYQTISTW